MFGVGPTELLVILVIALLVLGPKRLPELAHSLGKGLAEFRKATSDLSTEFDSARTLLDEETRKAAKDTGPDRRVSRTARDNDPKVAEEAKPEEEVTAASSTSQSETGAEASATETSKTADVTA
ncbi:MAG: twin-arginine translocase TatA/TatE family subunit [Deltaproteobacteria bacterium]|nr:twin-arginine translocase TatA/TatE family subunit [Deltaproteobacteria bacterium]